MQSGEGCSKPSEWTIWTGPTTDDCTASCTDHVGEMLVMGENKVYPEEGKDVQCCYIEP